VETRAVDEGPNQTRRAPMLSGVLIVNKPSGMTSRDVVDRVVRFVPGAKVGHAGTLDPLASGVLIVCIGSATRLVEMLHQLSKSYRTVVQLGARSDTLDADGRIEVETSPRVPSERAVGDVLPPFLGQVAQQPPDYSALKVKGRRAYDLARAGQVVELTPRMVQIDRLVMLRYDWPLLELEIDCGSGTYIRSIARDVGEALGCGGYVQTLIRTRVGPFILDQAVDPRTLSADSIDRHTRSALDALPDLPRATLDRVQIEAVVQGRRLWVRDLPDQTIPEGQVAMLDPAGNLVALAEHNPREGWLQPRKVLI
jgi:tRNA pseudouridine55 synthase